MQYLLAHDVGTSGDKAALITPDGRILATAYEPYPIHFPRPNWAEQTRPIGGGQQLLRPDGCSLR
jgi:xylulokinase